MRASSGGALWVESIVERIIFSILITCRLPPSGKWWCWLHRLLNWDKGGSLAMVGGFIFRRIHGLGLSL
jgi:hypothetical protein